MRNGEYLALYLKSPLGIGSGFGGIALAVSGMALGLPAAAALAAAAGLVALVGIGSAISGWGSRQAVEERDAALRRLYLERLSKAKETRDRLTRLRTPDAEVAEAVSLVVLAAGEYLEAGRIRSLDDPLADEAIEASLDIVDLFMAEMNESSVEKRFRLEDADPFDSASARVVSALRERAGLLRERRIQMEGGLPAKDRMAVREELQ